jgi:hypothetical protein
LVASRQQDEVSALAFRKDFPKMGGLLAVVNEREDFVQVSRSSDLIQMNVAIEALWDAMNERLFT